MAIKTYGYNLKDITYIANSSRCLTGPYGKYLQVWADKQGKKVYANLCSTSTGFINVDSKKYFQVGRFCRPFKAQELADKIGKIKMSFQNSMWNV